MPSGPVAVWTFLCLTTSNQASMVISDKARGDGGGAINGILLAIKSSQKSTGVSWCLFQMGVHMWANSANTADTEPHIRVCLRRSPTAKAWSCANSILPGSWDLHWRRPEGPITGSEGSRRPASKVMTRWSLEMESMTHDWSTTNVWTGTAGGRAMSR